jgi:ParB family chromosome partitioning protein
MKEEIKLIPIKDIRIINPRFRDRKKFETIIQSIKNLGLKKPIQVSLRTKTEEGGPGYDLVCGQGRIEAFQVLGYQEIPAVVVEVSKQERLLRSLVENIARRFPSPAELLAEVERLKGLGYSNVAIGKKLDISDTTVSGFIALKNSGEERLLDGALSGKIPLTIAIDIARTEGAEAQRELLKAYEKNQLTGVKIRTIKRLMEQRSFLGKHRGATGRAGAGIRTSADSMVNAYRKESQRQKEIIRKAKASEEKLIFIVQAFSKLLKDEAFADVLSTEELSTLPDYLAERINGKVKVAA